jgi:hypothetical protein
MKIVLVFGFFFQPFKYKQFHFMYCDQIVPVKDDNRL